MPKYAWHTPDTAPASLQKSPDTHNIHRHNHIQDHTLFYLIHGDTESQIKCEGRRICFPPKKKKKKKDKTPEKDNDKKMLIELKGYVATQNFSNGIENIEKKKNQ